MIERVQRALDEDLAGLADVKARILDHLRAAAAPATGDPPGLCLVGPPGVGKTALCASIARALGRPLARVSLAAVRDASEIRGHPPANPGLVARAIERCGDRSPVLALEHVDRMSSDGRSDAAAALLDLLDPSLRAAFRDRGSDAELDLSSVLVIATATQPSSIPEPLRDRLDLVRIPGYTEDEKLAIARRFLVPRQTTGVEGRSGVDGSTIEPDVLRALIRGYTREAGVRDLERKIGRVMRRLAREPGTDAANLAAILGPPVHEALSADRPGRVGVALALAHAAAGGELLEVEASAVPGRGRVQITGALGDTMRESASVALSWARGRAASLGIDADHHRTADLHVHVPSSATPKDGPSAGIALAAAIVSALSRRKIRGDFAMSGELTLHGRVLPVGGVREKVAAARREGITDVVLPRGNAADVDALPGELRDGIRFHLVGRMEEALPRLLHDGEAHP